MKMLILNNGAFYLQSQTANYVYNLAYKDSLGNSKYTLRVFDPSNNWRKVENDIDIVRN